MNYGFAFMDNTYDSYAVRMKMKMELNDIQVYKMVDFRGKDYTEEIRFKTNQFNALFMSYLRSILKSQFFKGKVNQPAYQRILLTKPRLAEYERYCLQFYE